MQDYQKQFIEFAIQQGVLQFGTFELKSGRISPYFFNAGGFDTGAALHRLGSYYASALAASGLEYDMIFGPAYKGIPLAAAASISLETEQNRNVPFAFNRKEAKDHGEGGNLVGAPVTGKVVIIDDVITAGTAIREVMEILSETNGEAVGVVVAIDRQERGQGDKSAIQEVQDEYGIKVVSVVNLSDIIEYLEGSDESEKTIQSMKHYRETYGI